MPDDHAPLAVPTGWLPESLQAWTDANPDAAMWAGLGTLLVVGLVAYALAAWVLLPLAGMLITRTRSRWDDALIEHKTLARLAPLAPAYVIHWGVALLPTLPEVAATIIQRLAVATMIIVIARSFSAMLNAINTIYAGYALSRSRPIKGYLQVAKILGYFAAAILVIAVLMDREPWLFLSGLGAMTAVLLLIFRDTILSFVAGVQLTGNDLIRVGDWIEMPQFNADGDVVDISLNVVRVQNWDKTFTVIPTHKFLEHSFRNWRSMFDGGGRRIMRAMHIDTGAIRFLTPEEIERFRRFILLTDYISEKVPELDEYNRERVRSDGEALNANVRRLTNIGTFRIYTLNYLRQHPGIHQDMTLLVRQLEPGPHGLPLQLYAFTNETAWASYERIQADIFDHLLAIAPEFGLRIFQEPSGADLSRLARTGA